MGHWGSTTRLVQACSSSNRHSSTLILKLLSGEALRTGTSLPGSATPSESSVCTPLCGCACDMAVQRG
jgi:hypothetical protein